MPDDPVDEFKASDLPIALYLNQRVTFDLLAALEDGFAQLTTVQESSTDEKKLDTEVGIGISNVFAFLAVALGGRRSGSSGATTAGSSTQELVHTPTSLFARLRQELMRRELVKTIASDGAGFDAIEAGNFVEFQAVLHRSPLVDVLSTFKQLVPMMDAFSGSPPPAAGKGVRSAAQQPNQTQVLQRQIDTMLQAVTAAGSQDLVADCGKLRFVLTAEEAYFVDPTMNDVIDGTFRVFGKVTRTIAADSDESISLLRKSALGNLGGVAEQLATAFSTLPDAGFTGQEVSTEVAAPTLQVIPIAIFA